MILRPVTPQSAAGPPFTKLPVGFTMKRVLAVEPRPSTRGASTCVDVVGARSRARRPPACWVETSTSVTRTRPAVLVHDRDLRLAVGPQPGHGCRRAGPRPGRARAGGRAASGQRHAARASPRWRSRTRCPGRRRPARRPCWSPGSTLRPISQDWPVMCCITCTPSALNGGRRGRRSRSARIASRTIGRWSSAATELISPASDHHAGLARAPRRPRGCAGRARGRRRGWSRR